MLSLTDNSSLDRTTIELGLADTYLFIDPNTLPAWSSEPSPIVSAEDKEALTFVEDEASGGPVNITTPHDMNRYFQLLLDGQVINENVSAEIMDILQQQMVDDRFPYLLPPGTEMAHKTGNLDHVVHDVGIIWTTDGPVILIAMIEDPPNDDIATQIIQRLALIAAGERDIPAFTDQAVETVESTEKTTPEPDQESEANG